MNWPTARIIVTGAHGFLGQALLRALHARNCPPANIFAPRKADFDLTDPRQARAMYDAAFAGNPADLVIHAAGYVGGIAANIAQPGTFFYDNMMMGLNVVEQFRQAHLIDHNAKLVLVGTASSYPEHADVPFTEDDLWSGFPHPSGAPYGLAKKALGAMLEMYQRQYGLRSACLIPINMYGPGDHFDLDGAHVIAALVRRFVAAADEHAHSVTCWGTGNATREFLFVEDAAQGILQGADLSEDSSPINLGTGEEISIRDAARIIAAASGFTGEILFDASKPDGQARRCMNISRAQSLLHWRPKVSFVDGIRQTVAWYRSQHG